MLRRHTRLIAWMMLIGFTVNAVIPSATQAWLLCIGCDDSGVAITQADRLNQPESCCPGEASQMPTPVAFNATEEHADDCGCIDLTLDKKSLVASLTKPQLDGPTPLHATCWGPVDPVLTCLGESLAWRGPPDGVPVRTDRSLFGQRALLLI